MQLRRPIYLDHAATTPADPRVVERMVSCLTADGTFGNPASRSHAYGWAADRAVEKARGQVAELLGAEAREIVWTSGATEADNLAILGAARARIGVGRHLVTTAIEHPAVLDACAQLEREGWEVAYLLPGPGGAVTPGQVAAALRDDTALVSVMFANNETGVLHDIAAIGEITAAAGVPLHVDATQGVGKLPIDLRRLRVDLLACSAHKVHGPKGVGVLFVRDRPDLLLQPLLYGGGQERGLRPGTLPTHQIVGMGEALRIAGLEMAEEATRMADLRDRLWTGVADLAGIVRNGDPERCVPGILNIRIDGVDGETLIMALREVALSSGSACASSRREPSHVLRAMGLTPAEVDASLRLSLGRFTTAQEIGRTVDLLRETVPRLRALRRASSQGQGTSRRVAGLPQR